MLRRISFVVEGIVAVAVAVTVVLLFANQPEESPAAPEAAVEAAGGVDGASVFGENCAVCHGGDGSGALGPRLAGGAVVTAYPDPADQIAVVTHGRAGMPAFGDKLSADEIAAVVEYTRTGLAHG